MSKWIILITLILLMPVASAVDYRQLIVVDNANILDPVYKDKIKQLALSIEKETTVEIVIVTVKSLEGESIDTYAERLFREAGIGKKDKDNGLLILVAKQEREYRFEVGYGLEGTITDSMKVNIGDRIIVPNFRNGEYGKGIYEAMVVVEGLVKGNEEVISQYSMKQGGSEAVIPYDMGQSGADAAIPYIFALVFIIVILFIIFVVIMGILNYQKYSSDPEWRRRHRYRERPVEFPIGGGWHSGGGFGGGFGGGGGFSGGGFGGFGGGRSGGGGFGGKW